MPTDQPRPIFVVIGLVALAVMAASVYVGVTAQLSAGHTPVVASEPAPAPASTTN